MQNANGNQISIIKANPRIKAPAFLFTSTPKW